MTNPEQPGLDGQAPPADPRREDFIRRAQAGEARGRMGTASKAALRIALIVAGLWLLLTSFAMCACGLR